MTKKAKTPGPPNPNVRDKLACPLTKQWQHYGHSYHFTDAYQQLAFKFNEHGDGTCDVVT